MLVGGRPGRAEITGSREGAIGAKFRWEKDNFSPELSGRVGGAVSWQRPSGYNGAVRQAGPHVHALALGRGRPVGPGVRQSWTPAKGPFPERLYGGDSSSFYY